MNIQLKLITPSYAKDLLESNINNRKVKMPVVLKYANEMALGQWKTNTGELIKVSKTNKLIDGQHRLLALIKAQVSIEFHVAYDVEDSIFDVLDTGTVRNSSDVFSIERVKYNALLPGIIQFYHTQFLSTQKNNRLSNAQLLEAYKKRQEYWEEIARFSDKMYRSFAMVLPSRVIGGLYAIFNDINEKQSTDFITSLCTGDNVVDRVFSVLRNKLIQDKTSTRKLTPMHKNALIVKAWNAYRLGNEVKGLSFDATRENFPKPI